MSQGFAPFTPIYAGSTSSSPFDYGSPTKLPSAGTLSLSQIVAMLAAKKQKPQRSFLGDIEHGAKFGINKVGWAFDKLERPAYAVANAVDQGKVGQGKGHFDVGQALHGAREGFMGREKTNFGAVLAHNHILDNHHFLRGALGLTADIGADPLSYTGVGAVRKVGADLIEQAAKASLETTYRGVKVANAAEHAARFRGYANTLKQGGAEYAQRAAHATKVADVTQAIADGGHALTPATRAELNIARETAAAEAKLYSKRQLAIRFGTMRHNVHVPIAPLPKASQKLGNAGIPVLSKVADTLGHAFKPGYKDEIMHQALLTRRHQGERLASEYFQQQHAIFSKVGKLSPKAQRDALHYFEKPGKYKAVVKAKDGKYILNPKHIARALKAGLSEEQIKFVQAMHDTGEFFAARHREYGTAFTHMGEKGKLYVPHIVTKTGEGVTDAMLKTNLLTKKGFQKGRLVDYSIKELHDLHQMGALPHGVETNPFTLMAMHGRSVANQHADQNLINHMSHALGTPAKLVDRNKLLVNQAQHAAVTAQIAKHGVFDEAAHQGSVDQVVASHEHAATERLKAFQQATRDAIHHHLEVAPWQQTTKATVARLSQRAIDAQGRHAAEVAAIRAGKYKPLVRDLKPLMDARTSHAVALKGFERKATALMSEQKKLLKGTIKNPDYNSEMMRGVNELTNEFGHKLHFPHEVADAMERLKQVMKDDDVTLNAFADTYRKWLGKWKLGVTSVNPSYATRNTLSDYWNMYLSGVPLHAMPIYGAKAAKMMRDAKIGGEAFAAGKAVTPAQHHAVSVLLDAYDSGILSGLFAGDVAQVSHMIQHSNTKLTLLQQGHVAKAAAKLSMDVNRNRENWGRLTHYLYRVEHGDSAITAAEKVRAAHFDYEDLTPFEQKRMKLIAPFYTWSRKNIPFQVKAMVESPGQMLAFPQLGAEADPGGKDGIVPGYMNDSMYLKFGSKFYNPMIGITDLGNAANPLQLGKSLLSPAIKTPLELYANKNLLTGQPIKDPTGYDRNPVRGGIASELLSLIPGANVGETGRKDANGKMVHGVGADPRLTYLLGQTPITNLLFDQGSKVRGDVSPENQHRATLAWLTGINGTSVNQKQQQEFAILHFTKDVLPALMKNLRAHGTIPPAQLRAMSPTQKRISEILFASLQGR